MGFGKDGKGEIISLSTSVALGALASGASIIVGTKVPITEDFRVIKAEALINCTGLTNGEGRGLAVYLVDGDYTAAEFEAFMEGSRPTGPNDSVNAEIASRFWKRMGVMSAPAGSQTDGLFLNPTGGGHLSETIRWTFQETKSWNYIVYNHGIVLTTGATCLVKGKHFGVWVR